jgi:hypothetical protein
MPSAIGPEAETATRRVLPESRFRLESVHAYEARQNPAIFSVGTVAVGAPHRRRWCAHILRDPESSLRPEPPCELCRE